MPETTCKREREGVGGRGYCRYSHLLISWDYCACVLLLLLLMSFWPEINRSVCSCISQIHTCISDCICGAFDLVLPLITRCPNKFETKTVIKPGVLASPYAKKGYASSSTAIMQTLGRRGWGRAGGTGFASRYVSYNKQQRNTSTDDATHKRLKIKIPTDTHTYRQTHTAALQPLEAVKTWNTSERGQNGKTPSVRAF